MTLRRAVALVALAAASFTACNSEPPLDLSPEAAKGRDIANSSGCASCHGKNGQGVTGPSWQGIYDTMVPLESGDATRADDDYLYRAITDPQADVRRNWTLKMPTNKLTDDQVAAVITYIKELA